MGAVTPAKRRVQRSKAREESGWAQDGGREHREMWTSREVECLGRGH